VKAEVRVTDLRPYGAPRKCFAFTLPDSLTLEQGCRARKFIRTMDRNWKSKVHFLK
jgi:hypothetical protein